MFTYLRHIFVLMVMSLFVYGDITGYAFKDYNGDGIKQAGEPAIEGIAVKAYRAGALVKETTTTSDGTYTLATGSSSDLYRVEFDLPDSGCLVEKGKEVSSSRADIYGSSVQFVTSTQSDVNYAVSYPYDISLDENPITFTSILVHGDPNTDDTSDTSTGNVASIIKFNYNDTGLAENGGRKLEDTSTVSNRTADETGPAWTELVKQ